MVPDIHPDVGEGSSSGVKRKYDNHEVAMEGIESSVSQSSLNGSSKKKRKTVEIVRDLFGLLRLSRMLMVVYL